MKNITIPGWQSWSPHRVPLLKIPSYFYSPHGVTGWDLTSGQIQKLYRLMKLPNLTVGVSSPNASSGAESLPGRQAGLRSENTSPHPRAYARGISRRGIKSANGLFFLGDDLTEIKPGSLDKNKFPAHPKNIFQS
jgi:hypothetical protein